MTMPTRTLMKWEVAQVESSTLVKWIWFVWFSSSISSENHPSLSNKNDQEPKLFWAVWIKDFIFVHFPMEAVLGYNDVSLDNIVIVLIDFGKLLKCKKKTNIMLILTKAYKYYPFLGQFHKRPNLKIVLKWPCKYQKTKENTKHFK